MAKNKEAVELIADGSISPVLETEAIEATIVDEVEAKAEAIEAEATIKELFPSAYDTRRELDEATKAEAIVAEYQKRKKDKKEVAKARAKEIMVQYKVDTVYENPQGNFFTQISYALASVGGDKAKLTIHKK